MIDRAKELAAKRSATVELRRAEVDRREAGGSPAALERAKASLAKAEKLAREANSRVAKLERKASAKAAFDGPMNRLLDKVAARAPAVMKRWANERGKEPKKLEARKKQLARSVTKDQRQDHTARRRHAATMLPEDAATFPSGPIIPYTPPPQATVERVGLVAGDYRLIAKSPAEIEAGRAPKLWTAEYVGRRLSEAHSTLRRLPMVTRPKEFGTNWPDWTYTLAELSYQAGSGALLAGRNHVIGGTGARDVARMNEALSWPMEFLSKSPIFARSVNQWSSRDPDGHSGFINEALEFIAKKLNEKGVPVT